MISFKIFMFFFGLFGVCIVQMYNCKSGKVQTKLLPCGMLIMIIYSGCLDIVCSYAIINKGFTECVGEIIALIFGIIFTSLWIAVYFVTDDHVKCEYDFGERKDEAAPQQPRNDF